jgi:hypothetical protein
MRCFPIDNQLLDITRIRITEIRNVDFKYPHSGRRG